MAVFNQRCFTRSRLLTLCLGALAGLGGSVDLSTSCFAQQLTSQWSLPNSMVSIDPTNNRQTVEMVVNTSREISANDAFKRVRIQNPEVIKAIPLEGGNRLQLSALKTGVTQIDLLGADDSVHTVQVMVLGDVRELEAILHKIFPEATLELTPIQQGLIISGFVSNSASVDEVTRIAEQYFPTVVNKVQVTGVHTIQLQVQIMEVSRTKLRALGIDWALVNGNDVVGSTVSGLLNVSGTNVATTGTETFKWSLVENNTSFFNSVQALRQNSLVKVLASPTLTAVDGRPASFNSGGEFPIIVPSGLGQVGVQFREFGTRLDYVAKVLGNGKIYLEVRPYVSEIDPSRSVSISGISVPGLRSRFLETGVELNAGQTLALAGLLQVRSETINIGLPVLADMPYIGALFRSSREEQNEIELLITVTPDFAGPMDPCEVPRLVPGISTQSPTDKELFWKGYMETPVGDGEYMSGPQMIEGVPMGYTGYPTGPAQVGLQSLPVPNPAAMSVGPNAPTLVRQSEASTKVPSPALQTATGPQSVNLR